MAAMLAAAPGRRVRSTTISETPLCQEHPPTSNYLARQRRSQPGVSNTLASPLDASSMAAATAARLIWARLSSWNCGVTRV